MQTLKIIPKKSAFFTDDFIEGQVELSTSVQIIINDINIALNSNESWFTFSKELDRNISENKAVQIITQSLDVKNKLHINTNLIALKPGKFTFDFRFKSPKILEPSFEYPGKVDKAYVRYFLSSNIISPYIRGNTTTFIILKQRQRIEMNKQVILTSANSIHKWGLFDGGTTKLNITSINGTDNFRFGEDVKFNIDIDNLNGKLIITECKIVLKRSVKFKDSYGQVKKEIIDELFSNTIKTPTTQGEQKTFPFVLSLKNIENKNFALQGSGMPYTDFSDINYFLPSMKTFILECSYTIKFTLYFNKFVTYNDRPRIIMKAIICHQTLDEYKAETNHKINLNRSHTMPNNPNNYLPPPNKVPPNMMQPPNLGPPHMMPPPMMQPPHLAPPNMMQSPNLGPPQMQPPPMMQPPNLIRSNTVNMPQNQNGMPPQNPNMMPPMNGGPNFDFKKSISTPINNGIPPQQFNPMNNGMNMNNIEDEELPSMEEVESGNNMNNNNNMENNNMDNNNNNMDNNFGNFNNNNDSLPPNNNYPEYQENQQNNY